MIRFLLFLLTSFLCFNAATAQVKFYDLRLKEALIKAQEENKIVMVMGSASW